MNASADGHSRIFAMPSDQAKAEFAERLKFALRRSSTLVKGATDLARLFNLRHHTASDTDTGISVQSTHKWLTGRSIPKPDKIETLATWLDVSAHWLHYGSPPADPFKNQDEEDKPLKYSPSPEALTLAKKIDTLPEHQKYLIAELVTQFYGKKPK